MNNIILGIDPGIKGALALYQVDKKSVDLYDMPTLLKKNGKRHVDVYKLNNLLSELSQFYDPLAFVEYVHAMPGQGVTSSFSFGESFGCIRALLAANNIITQFVGPVKWKKHFDLPSDKEAARQKALEVFPKMGSHLKLKKHSDRAEALLIAKYGDEITNG